jgi:hypothetical protein
MEGVPELSSQKMKTHGPPCMLSKKLHSATPRAHISLGKTPKSQPIESEDTRIASTKASSLHPPHPRLNAGGDS